VELDEEIEQAEAWSDPVRADRARAESDRIVEELSRAVGLGGRDVRAASATERARSNATHAVRSAIRRLATHSPALGRHLDVTVRTGTFFSYLPDPRADAAWQL